MNPDAAEILRKERTGENRLAIFLVCVVGAALSAAPLGFIFGAERFAFWFVSGIAVVSAALVSARSPTGGTAPHRTILEYVSASLSAAFGLGVLLLLALLVALIIYGLADFINVSLGWLGLNAALPASKVGRWLGIVLAVLFGSGAALANVSRTREQLFPGAQSAFYQKAVAHWRRSLLQIFLLLLIAAVAVGAWCKWREKIGPGFWMLIYLGFMFAASEVYIIGRKRSSTEIQSTSAIDSVFRKLGWQVLRQPRTGDATVDPLLSGLDFVASNGDRLWCVQVKTCTPQTPPIDWEAGAGLLAAARAYRTKRPEFRDVEPMLIVIDGKTTPSLDAFGRAEHVNIVQLSGQELEQMLQNDSEANLRILGVFLLEPARFPHVDGKPAGEVQV